MKMKMKMTRITNDYTDHIIVAHRRVRMPLP